MPTAFLRPPDGHGSDVQRPRWWWPGVVHPFAFVTSAWAQRTLVLRLARRQIEARYRGSVLGLLWSFVTPLFMLGVYAFVFSVVFQARWGMTAGDRREFALILFAGLLLFTLFADCVNRAPGLMLENVAYIKKVVFPLEVMPWVMLLGALFNAGVSLLILVAFQVIVRGVPPPTALLLPLVAVPLILLTLGLSWFLSSLGVFIRDLQQVVGVATTALLFLSPIFYPPSAVPEAYRRYIYANPITPILEQSRQVLFYAQMPDWRVWALLVAGGWLVAWFGYAWFVRTRKGFGDVV